MSERTLLVMGVQLACEDKVAKNAEAVAAYIQRAGQERADFCVFPEMVLTGYHNRFRQVDAEAAYEVVSEACRQAQVCALVGAGEWRRDKCYNQVRVYDDTGALLGVHEKILLTDGDAEMFMPGPTLRVFQHKGLTFGCLICNDFWCNPAGTSILDMKLVYQLARLGAKVIFHSVASGSDPLWRQFHAGNLIARAATAHVWVATANQACGSEEVNCPSGAISSAGEWVVQAPLAGEGHYLTELEL